MPGDGLLEGFGKAGGRKLQMGQEQATRGTAVEWDLVLLSKGSFCILTPVKEQFFISKAELS